MNHQTERIIEKAKDSIRDECVFSSDQIKVLVDMIDKLAEAIDKETSLCGGSQGGGQGF